MSPQFHNGHVTFADFEVIPSGLGGSDLCLADGSGRWTLALLHLRQLVQRGLALQSTGPLELPVEVIWEEASLLEDGDGYLATILGLEQFTGLVHVDIDGDFVSPDAKVRVRFPNKISSLGSIDIALSRTEGPFLMINGRHYFAGLALYRLLSIVHKANAEWKSLTNTQRYRHAADLSSLADHDRISLSPSITDFSLSTLNGLKMFPERIPGTDQWRFVLDGHPEGHEDLSLSADLMKLPEEKSVLSFRDQHGGYGKVVIEPEIRKYVRYAQGKKSVSSQELRDFARKPPESWLDEEIDLSGFYGDRVEGVGVFVAPAIPFVTEYQSQWLPGLETGGDDSELLVLKSPDEIVELDSIVTSAERQGSPSAQFRGHDLLLEDLKRLLNLARAQSNGAGWKPTKPEGLPVRVAVLAKLNLDEVQYSEKDYLPKDFRPTSEIPHLSSDIVLKAYQEEGVGWLWSLYQAGSRGALLADDMGLGKTLQVLSFLHLVAAHGDLKQVLIVAPVSLLENWVREFHKFFPKSSLRFAVANSDPALLSQLTPNETGEDGLVVLASYEFLRANSLKLAAFNWSFLVLDEAHVIKNPVTLVTNAAKTLQAKFKIAITGTPVENTFLDVWCLMDFLVPGLLGAAKLFSRRYSATADDSDEAVLEKGNQLRKEIGIHLLRRMKAVVASELPRKEGPLFEMELMPAGQEALYDQVVANSRLPAVGTQNPVLNALFKLRKLCDHPAVLDPSLAWGEESDKGSAKFLKLVTILENARVYREKCLVFAEYRRTQEFLALAIRSWFGIDVDVINGDTPTGERSGSRMSIIDHFQKGEGFGILILSPRAAGVGLNLTAANRVIHVSRHWNPSKEDQATDRAYRLGQTKTVFVHHLVSLHSSPSIRTFDQVLNDLIESKRKMRDAVLVPRVRDEIDPNKIWRDMMGAP